MAHARRAVDGAFAGTTFLMGLMGSCLGFTHVLLAMTPDGGDLAKRQEILFGGTREALLPVTLGAVLTALQLVIWAIARRRVDLADRGS